MTDLDNLRAQVEILKWARAKKAEITELENNAKAAIQEALGDDEAGTVDGHTVVTWKGHKRTSLDSAALKKADPETYALYSKTTEVRRFEVVDE